MATAYPWINRPAVEVFAGGGSGVFAKARLVELATFAGGGSGAIANLSARMVPTGLLGGSGSGAIATLQSPSTATAAGTLLAGSGSGAIATLGSPGAAAATGTRTAGTAAPLLGNNPATTYTGWTRAVDANQDDEFLEFGGWPFAFALSGTSYTSCYLSSNGFTSFGGGTSAYLDLSASNPNLPKVMFGANDLSWQRVYTITASNRVAFRWEGYEASSGVSPGSSSRIVEVTFWKPGSSSQLIEVRTGVFAAPNSTAPFLVASSTTSYASATTLGAYQSWVFEGNLTGTSWTLYSNSYVTT
jgi:hypothetical protein